MIPSALFRVVNPPASAADVQAFRDRCGPMPESYIEFLRAADGVESCINDRGGDCLALWRAHEVADLNEAYGITHYLPDFIAIGSDGGGDAIGYHRIENNPSERWPIVRIGFGNLDRSDFIHLGAGFREWWSSGCPLRVSPAEPSAAPDDNEVS